MKKLSTFLLSGCLLFKKLCFVSIILLSILLCYDILAAHYVTWEVKCSNVLCLYCSSHRCFLGIVEM